MTAGAAKTQALAPADPGSMDLDGDTPDAATATAGNHKFTAWRGLAQQAEGPQPIR